MLVRSRGLLAASIALLGVAGCSDPDLNTDLRPDGPPEVLTVMIGTPAANGQFDPIGVLETATFCKTQGPNDGAAGVGDDKRPGLVNLPAFVGQTQVCPDDLTMGVPEVTYAPPLLWNVRVVFDELLNDNIEQLIPISTGSGSGSGSATNFRGSLAQSNPVTIMCDDGAGGAATAVPYFGGSYYNPAGNKFTWPVGPSLEIIPDDSSTVPSGATCTVTINDSVTDKDGNMVPADQRGAATGPKYTFQVSGLAITSTTPSEAGSGSSAADIMSDTQGVTITFNDVVDPTSIDSSDFTLFKAPGTGSGSDFTPAPCGSAGAAEVPPADIGIFQAGDGMGDVDDPTSVEIYDESATGVTTDPADPMPTGNFFTPGDTYTLFLSPNATASDGAGGSSTPITSFPDAAGSATNELCFTVDPSM